MISTNSQVRLYGGTMYPPPVSNSSLSVSGTTGTSAPPRITRTPSPSPSEIVALKQKGIFNVRASIARRTKGQLICLCFTLGVLLVVTILFAVFHNNLVNWIRPTANAIHGWKAGWLIPIVILAIMSFPPIIGHEIIMIILGVVWGPWAGFGIASAGTLVGEIANFFVYSTLCRARCEKYEKTKIDYACLARVVREGGLKVAIIVRYSIIPPHFSTVVFATCGMKFWVFLVSAIVSLPRHFITVYIGVTLNDEAKDVTSTTKEKIITYIVLAATIVVSVVALRYVNKLTQNVKDDVIYQRRKARQVKEELVNGSLGANASTATTLDKSTTSISLEPRIPV